MDFLIKLIKALLALLEKPASTLPNEEPLPDLSVPAKPRFELRAGALIDICGCSLHTAEKYAAALAAAMDKFEIITPLRAAHFLAQIAHESGGFKYSREIWGPTQQQLRYERDFTAPWPQDPRDARLPMYERNRLAFRLGNSEPGDGRKFSGRGLIQLTGRANYLRSGNALGYNFIESPEVVERAAISAEVAAEFWARNGCNELADKDDITGVTKRVNGGTNGLAERTEYLRKAKIALNA